MLLTRWPDPVTECLCFDRLFWRQLWYYWMLSAKSLRSLQHALERTKISNTIVNSQKYWKVKIKWTAISQIPTWRILSPKATVKRVQKLQKTGSDTGSVTLTRDPTRLDSNTALCICSAEQDNAESWRILMIFFDGGGMCDWQQMIINRRWARSRYGHNNTLTTDLLTLKVVS